VSAAKPDEESKPAEKLRARQWRNANPSVCQAEIRLRSDLAELQPNQVQDAFEKFGAGVIAIDLGCVLRGLKVWIRVPIFR